MNTPKPKMDNRGTLNVSKFQKHSNQPKFYGKALINGVEYRLKGWEKPSAYGEPWISLLFEEEGEEFETAKAKPVHTTLKNPQPFLGDVDDIPF